MVVGNVNKNNNNNNNNNTNNDHNNGGDGIGDNTNAHPSGIPREQIDNIMSGIANTGDVKMNNHRKKLRQRFDIIKKLGQGTYGKVQLGINKETGQEVAIKTIKKCKIEAEADLVRIRREVQIMSSVQHPNIIHIYEVFENREKMVLVMEFAAGGELYDYLSERKVLSEEEARRIFRQVATAVYYCHKHKICHRDLKLENILLDEYGNAKIADFGLSNVFDNHRLLATFCGSPLYASPEIVEGTPYQGPEVDCWSLGVLLYTLVYGSMPFDGSNFKRLVKQISQGDYYEPKKPSRASSLIKEMLTVCPQKRATIEQICSHWWVNENDPLSCLELAEDLANQTPVRLDVLLSLTPAAVTAEQLVVPSSGGHNMEIGKLSSTVTRSHSVGSLREIAIEPSTEAERRILDMVAAGGEAALMPSPTRTITPTHSPVQSKRKLETTLSTDLEAVKKKEKPGSSAALAKQHSDKTANATMETEDLEPSGVNSMESKNFSTNDMEKVGDICEQLMQSNHNVEAIGSENETGIASCAGSVTGNKVTEGTTCQKTVTKLDTVDEENTTTPLEGTKKPASKVLKKFINKHKTADLVNVIEQITPDLNTTVNSESCHQIQYKNATNPSKKNSGIKPKDSQNEPQSNKVTPERRKSRILETAEKFQQMNSSSSPSAQVNLKPKKFVIPGVNVGSYKKEYERRASASGVSFPQISTEQQVPEEESVKSATQEGSDAIVTPSNEEQSPIATSRISLEEARRSMENSIALLRQAQSDSTEKDKTEPIVNQLCTKTENINMDDSVKVEKNAVMERERKLQNARTIIGNAIQPAQSGNTMDDGQDEGSDIKTSTASITLKSATLPRRKTGGNTDVQLDIKPSRTGTEQSTMHFTTEMQHPIADLRTARDTRISYSPPIRSVFSIRAASLEPKEHIIPIQREPYTRTTSSLTSRSNSLSRQSTNDSDAETTSATSANLSQSTVVGSSQPIKKSPREFIIPIAVEGGGYIKPREDNTESSSILSHRNITSSSTFNRVRPGSRRISSLLNDDNSPFQKLRTSSRNRSCDGIDDEIPFTLHKLRSSRPIKKFSQETDSQSSGEEDDDDGFEILTAENLFSTLLQRVRALTNRLNVNHDITAGFPDSKRLFKNMRQAQNPFWNQEPFSSRRNNVSSNMTAPWRHSVSRNMGGKMDSIFTTDANDTGASPSAGVGVGVGSGTGAGAGAGAGTTGSKLPRGYDDLLNNGPKQSENSRANYKDDEFLDLTDLDLSRLKLSKKDIETLSNITPGLPKCFQEQLLAKLPPTQARKLSRTLSVQNSPRKAVVKIYKRSQSGRRDNLSTTTETSTTNNEKSDDVKAGDLESTSNNATTLTTTTNTTATAEKSLHKSIGRLHQNSNNQNSELDTITSQKEAFNKNQEESNVTYATNNSLCSSCTTTISEKYKYYSPYIKKHNNKESEESMAQKNREIILNGTAVSLTSNDCELQLPPQPSSDTLTRSVRLSQRRLSKLFKPESGANGIYGKSIEEVIDDSNTSSTQLKLKSKKHQQDKEMVLSDYKNPHNNSLDQEFSHNNIQREIRFIKNKDIDGCHLPVNKTVGDIAMSNECRRSVSRSKEINVIDKVELADKILEELQVLSRMSSQQPVPSASYNQFAEVDDNSVTLPNASSTATLVKKVKKVKVKEKKSSDFTMKKSKKGNSLQSENTTTTTDKMTNLFKWEEDCNNKRESKLRRPKSYPSRTACAINENSFCNSGSNIIDRNSPDKENTSLDVISTSNDSIHHESRLLRLKSYPSTKLAADVKTSKQVIEENCTTTQESTLKSNETLSEINKKIKVAKKSKMQKPINTYTNLMPSKECNEINAIVIATSALKTASTTNKSTEKTSEKKTNKGLLHAIGQKFEKLRDSAMHKERRTATTTTLIISDDKNKDKHSSSNIKTKTSCTNAMPETFDNDSGDDNDSYKNKKLHIREKHFSDVENNGGDKIKKTDVKRSRIDTLIRTLRERSIPRQSSTTTKTNLNDDPTKCLKRAISAEELIDALQRKSSVSRVFGLFKRSSAKEKYNERHENKVRSTRSTSNIERSSPPIYENIQRNVSKSLIKLNPSNDDIKLKDTFNNSRASTACKLVKTISPDICLVCLKNQLSVESCNHCNSLKNNNKLKRNDLVLDLTKMQKIDNVSKRVDDTNTKYMSTNCKIVNANFYSSLLPLQNNSNSPSCYNNNNNNSYNTSTKNNNNNNSYNNNYIEEMCPTKIGALSTHDVNHCNNISNNNFLTSPSCKNMTYYSSDSKSCQDDCVSNCTLISPTEEKELYFDNWSVCSEENYGRNVTTPSPLFRAAIAMHSKSNLQSITSSLNSRGSVGVGVDGSGGGGGGANETSNDPNESVIDRIKRRSFYSRFNEKKPKRISSIVGPNVVREYYREQQSVMKGLKSSTANRPYAKDDPRQERDYKRNSSPDITQQFLRPLKLSPIGTELKPPIPKIINNNVSDKEYSTTASGSSGRSRKSLNDIRIPAMSTMSKQYDSSLISDNVYFSTTSTTLPSSSLSIKTSPYDSSYYTTSTGSYYSTYHPKRRSSYALSGATLSSTSDGSGSGHSTSFNGYATMGRKPQRVYDQKNKSSLESSSATSSNYRVEIPNLRDYSAGTLRYRTTSATRNPTNI